MARHDDAGYLLLAGQDPVAVAEHMALTLDTVLGYLDRQVGVGKLRRSDIYFSISAINAGTVFTRWKVLSSLPRSATA